MGATDKLLARQRRIHRVRSRVHGSASRPRLAVTFSNRRVVAQLIDDEAAKTVGYAESKTNAKGSMSEIAADVATQISKQALAAKVRAVVLDRRHKPFHGRVKVFTDTVRKQGLEV